MSYDLFNYIFYMDPSDKLNKQTIWHHIVVILGMSLTLYVGYGFPSEANFLLLCEISTPFVNYRCMYKKEEMGNALPTFFSLMMFVLFTIVRVILFPIMMYYQTESYYYTRDISSFGRNTATLICIALMGALYLLQLFWYKIMLVGVMKACGSGKKSRSDIDDDFKE